MVRITEAIFEDGVFKPTSPIECVEHQRVRFTFEEVGPSPRESPEATLARLSASVERLGFTSTGRYPTREETYDRQDRS